MLKKLGDELATARQRQEPANITATYLQKLERGVVQTPSPRVLARVAHALGIPYLRLMELAGYLDEEQLAEVQSRTRKRHPLADQDLSPGQWRKVTAFIRELRSDTEKPRRGPGPKSPQQPR